MKITKIASCLEGTNDTSSFAVVDGVDVSAALGVHVSGGAGTGNIKIVGTHNVGHFNRFYRDSKNEVANSETIAGTGWTFNQGSRTPQTGDTPTEIDVTRYFQLSGLATAAFQPNLFGLQAQGNYISADLDRTHLYSFYVKQPSVEAEACSSLSMTLSNATTGDNHTLAIEFNRFGKAPKLHTTVTALTLASLYSITDAGNGWYRIMMGVTPDDFDTDELDGHKLRPVFYLGTNGVAESYQDKKIFVGFPQVEYSDDSNATKATKYYPVHTTDKYNFDYLPVIYETALAADTNTIIPILSHPCYQTSITNLTTDANISVYLIHNGR